MQQQTKPRNDQVVGGILLIGIGAVVLLGQYFDNVAEYAVLGLGVVLLALYLFLRSPGALIAGGILTGLGLGIIGAVNLQDEAAGAAVLFGLGGGFVGVWALGALMREPSTRTWPLIPGGILVAIGALVLTGAENFDNYEWLAPAILIGIGVLVVIAALLRRPTSPTSPTDQSGTGG
jgi:hypothetical protein